MITPFPESNDTNSATHDAIYQALVIAVQTNLAKTFSTELFFVDVKAATGSSLFTHYLNTFPESVRQQYFCGTCAEWLKQFGQMVTSLNGVLTAVAFVQATDYPDEVNAIMASLAKVVERSPITGIKHDTVTNCSIKNDGKFTHLSGNLRKAPGQPEIELTLAVKESKAGIYTEAHRTVTETFKRYTREDVTAFAKIFEHGALSTRREFKARANLFAVAFLGWESTKHEGHKSNIVWEALNISFTDFYHFNSSVLGTFLGNLVGGGEGYAIEQFLEQTDGVNYKRPTTAPTERELANAIQRARDEGLETGFVRRFAKPEDIGYWFWKKPEAVAAEGVAPKSIFDGLRTKDTAEVKRADSIDGGAMSFLHYVDKFLPKAKSISLTLDYHNSYPLIQLTQANDPEAKNLHNYDSTVAHYMYKGGSTIRHWADNNRLNVVGITVPAHHWANPPIKFGIPEEGVILILEGVKDRGNEGSAIFMENLSADYRDLRRVIEQYSNSTPLTDIEGEVAAGIFFTPGQARFNIVTELEDGTSVRHTLSHYS